MDTIQVASNRFTTKKYDPIKKISEADFAKIKTLLRLSPSSLNLQPWHFIIADDKAGKARVAKECEGKYTENNSKVLDASHVVVFCSKLDISDEHILRVANSEERDGRFVNSEAKEMRHQHMLRYVNSHREVIQDVKEWNSRQAYINMGNVLLGAGVLGIHATPMEGVDCKALDKEFNLTEQGFQTLAVVAFGYSAEDDYNAKLPKSRLTEEEIFSKA